MGIARPQPALRDRIQELGRSAEVGEFLLLGEIEQDASIARERRAVVDHQRRFGAQAGEEHVPHHPVGGAVIEIAIARPHVEVELEGLERLQQRAAGAVHDALRLAGGARSEEHEHRVIERQLRIRDVGGLVPAQPLVESHRLGNIGHVDVRIQIGNDDHLAHRRQALGDLAHTLERVVRLPVVAVAVGAEQHLGLDLAEAVDHAVDAEIGRARRPDDALRQRGERQHAGLGQVRDEGGGAIAGAQPDAEQRLHCPRDVARQVGVAHPAPEAVLVPEHQRIAAIAAAQQVLRDVEACLGIPARAGHLVAVHQHGGALARRDHAAGIPHLVPEDFRVFHRPAMEIRVRIELEVVLAHHLARKLRHLRFFDRAFRR